MNPVHVLVKLSSGYGLGDAVQMTAVMRHLSAARPHWIIDYQADKGREVAMIGLVRNVFAYGEPMPSASYDRIVDLHLYDAYAAWTDRPNTRVTQCLHERFGLEWKREFADYKIKVQAYEYHQAEDWLFTLRPAKATDFLANTKQFKIVAIHYQGDSSQSQKNLTHEQAQEICQAVLALGRVPLLLDWRNASPLTDQKTIHTTGRLATSLEWGRDAQMNAAIISQCEAFIGIDSGPGKCASATSTPTLICWTWHHPALFHDPCPNTAHLIPADHRQNPLLQGNREVADWFEANYAWRTYCQGSLIQEVNHWLEMVLKP